MKQEERLTSSLLLEVAGKIAKEAERIAKSNGLGERHVTGLPHLALIASWNFKRS
ncbi:hypothetical protein G9G39_22765 [Cronobacter sp. EKM101R]|uniref:hypothetical protein n=1 Tax=unclassified Cronobacter TaxID=2649764 RepID=UPI0013EE1DDE|nr:MULTISPECIES: hypothetical protein [unclassified Cronobacter]KAF6589073.1 hypothetical protein G9G39_22765 [Cronobacter sp. EKM101R]KAF6592605.1 hypothetical protein G9G38_22275 [Cronobacter sp. EKM102R]